MDDLTRLLGDLVSIASVNPMGRALAGPEVLETRLTGYLEDWFGGKRNYLLAAAGLGRP